MTRKKKPMPPSPEVALPANCSIRDCAALKSELLKAASLEAAVTVQLAAVERIDTASLQLLFAFARDRKARSLDVVWSGESMAFSQALKALGLGAAHGFPPVRG